MKHKALKAALLALAVAIFGIVQQYLNAPDEAPVAPAPIAADAGV